jgi:SAM-dependent methyltransferase
VAVTPFRTLPTRAARRAHLTLTAQALRRLPGPVSDMYGFDRGTPIDRPYIEAFLTTHADDVRGCVLEVKDPGYAERFGAGRTSQIDVIDLEPGPTVSYVADLDERGSLPTGTYDCIILTQVFEFLDPDRALPNLWAALRPGGVLLMSVPCLTRLELPRGDLWRFTADGLAHLLASHLPGAEVHTEQHGNAPAAAAYLIGFAVEEVGEGILEPDDWRFPIVTMGRVRRPA